MKKLNKILLSLLLGFSLFSGVDVFAEENDMSKTSQETEYYKELEMVMEEYFNEKAVNDFNQLSDYEKNEWLYIQEQVKNQYRSSEIIANSRASLSDYTGGVLITFDSGISSWNHGHAAFGSGLGTVEILGSSYVVSKYGKERIERFQSSSTGGFYAVKGAAKADNTTANVKSKDFMGRKYITDDLINGIYCSNLVSQIWFKAGFKLDGATPHTLAADYDLVLQFNW